MTTYNTGNPIGSTDSRDRLDNSENFDKAINSIGSTWDDRLGVARDTFEGALSKLSFYRVGTFAAGYTLTNMRQTLEYSGHEYSWAGTFPKVVAVGATPATSGGIASGAWVDRTDISLRSEINIVTKIFSSVADMVADSTLVVGQKVETISYYDGLSIGGARYNIVAAGTGTADCGSHINLSNGLQAAVIVKSGLSFEQFGAYGDGTTDDYAAIRNAFNWVQSVYNRAIRGTIGKTYAISHGLVVNWDGKFQDITSKCTINFTGATLIPLTAGITLLKCSRNYVRIIHPTVRNPRKLENITALAISPEDVAQTTTRVSQCHCEIIFPNISGTKIGIYFKPGPTVSLQDSGCFYNTICTPELCNVACGFYFDRSSTGSVLTTRTTIYNPKHVYGNCMFYINGADSITVYAGTSELLTQGTWPSATPTDIVMVKTSSGDALSSSNCHFPNFYGEAGNTPYNLMATQNVDFSQATFFGYINPPVTTTYAENKAWVNDGKIMSMDNVPTNDSILAVKNKTTGHQLYFSMPPSGNSKFYSDRVTDFLSTIGLMTVQSLTTTGNISTIGAVSSTQHLTLGNSGCYVDVSGVIAGTVYLYNSSASGTKGFMFGGMTFFKPDTDNGVPLGAASNRWSVVYAGTGTINTSDARTKTFFDITAAETATAKQLKSMMRKFKFNASIAEKGDKARYHFGVSAQEIAKVFSDNELDATEYGLLCHDDWDAQPEVLDEDGNVIAQAIPAGDRYGIRYDELICFIISAM